MTRKQVQGKNIERRSRSTAKRRHPESGSRFNHWAVAEPEAREHRCSRTPLLVPSSLHASCPCFGKPAPQRAGPDPRTMQDPCDRICAPHPSNGRCRSIHRRNSMGSRDGRAAPCSRERWTY